MQTVACGEACKGRAARGSGWSERIRSSQSQGRSSLVPAMGPLGPHSLPPQALPPHVRCPAGRHWCSQCWLPPRSSRRRWSCSAGGDGASRVAKTGYTRGNSRAAARRLGAVAGPRGLQEAQLLGRVGIVRWPPSAGRSVGCVPVGAQPPCELPVAAGPELPLVAPGGVGGDRVLAPSGDGAGVFEGHLQAPHEGGALPLVAPVVLEGQVCVLRPVPRIGELRSPPGLG